VEVLESLELTPAPVGDGEITEEGSAVFIVACVAISLVLFKRVGGVAIPVGGGARDRHTKPSSCGDGLHA